MVGVFCSSQQKESPAHLLDWHNFSTFGDHVRSPSDYESGKKQRDGPCGLSDGNVYATAWIALHTNINNSHSQLYSPWCPPCTVRPCVPFQDTVIKRWNHKTQPAGDNM